MVRLDAGALGGPVSIALKRSFHADFKTDLLQSTQAVISKREIDEIVRGWIKSAETLRFLNTSRVSDAPRLR
jgi:hypothetical protein